MRFKRYLVWSLVGGVAALTLAIATSGTAGGVAALENFKCYTTLGAEQTKAVAIEDQFDISNGTVHNATSETAVNFCTPAALNRRGSKGSVSNTNSYLTLYSLRPPATSPAQTASAVVSNVFGDSQALRVYYVQNLAAATSVTGETAAHDLDNFKCYVAHDSDPKGTAQLMDRYESDKGVQVLDVQRICLPARITVDGGATIPAGNNTGALVCHGLKTLAFSGSVSIQNPISTETLSLGLANMLCVPSTLDSWTPVP